MTDNEENLIAAYRELYDALSEAIEATERTSPLGDDVMDIMTGPLGDAVRMYEALVEKENDD
jgi:hypothetical protein